MTTRAILAGAFICFTSPGCDAQPADSTLRVQATPSLSDALGLRSVGDKLLYVSERYPNFAGFYSGRDNRSLHIDVTEDRGTREIADLLRALFPSSIPEGARVGHVNVVKYSYRDLYDMSVSDGAVRIMNDPFFHTWFIDMPRNRLEFWFHDGISDEDIQLLLDESGIPVDALHFRGGWVVTPDANLR